MGDVQMVNNKRVDVYIPRQEWDRRQGCHGNCFQLDLV